MSNYAITTLVNRLNEIDAMLSEMTDGRCLDFKAVLQARADIKDALKRLGMGHLFDLRGADNYKEEIVDFDRFILPDEDN